MLPTHLWLYHPLPRRPYHPLPRCPLIQFHIHSQLASSPRALPLGQPPPLPHILLCPAAHYNHFNVDAPSRLFIPVHFLVT